MTMAAPSHIDPVLIRAYRETEYRVLGATAMVLRPDIYSPGLSMLHLAHAVDCSAFITAYNARSQSTDSVINHAQQARRTQPAGAWRDVGRCAMCRRAIRSERHRLVRGRRHTPVDFAALIRAADTWVSDVG